ncbi:MAG TPA: extracellular solute-binding protein [Pseudonocardiaceae bacterium]|jgi:multiple sugar transport system substrate-binding protein|nr:extracellular solute-binding protein [Pseudonocardiaceae bacterium]
MRFPNKISLFAGALAVSLLAAGCSGGGSTAAPPPSGSPSVSGTAACRSGATPVTFWAWVPGIVRAVQAFNASHPSICVSLSNVGAGSPEYTKLTDSLKAGSGAPDVAEVEFDELPSFEITHNVVDLSKFGAANVKNQFVPWAWQEVSQGSTVYAMPGDAGPMGLYYNSTLLAKYGITPPTTWAEFAQDAQRLHSADPQAYLTNFAAADLQWVLSLMAQDNAYPFKYSGGSNVTINFTGPKQTAFANYWQALLSAHEVNATTDVDATSFADMDKGIDATWLSSAWGPSYFATDAKQSIGAWRAAPLPQWTAGANVAANWGGSTYPVFSQSQHQAAAATFSEWLNSSDAAWAITKTAPSSLFPTYKPLLADPTFTGITVPLSGTSTPNAVFSQAASNAGAVQWPPFMTEALTVSATAFAGVLNGTQTVNAAFSSFQNTLVKYAQQQGFTVSTS